MTDSFLAARLFVDLLNGQNGVGDDHARRTIA